MSMILLVISQSFRSIYNTSSVVSSICCSGQLSSVSSGTVTALEGMIIPFSVA